MSDYIEDDPDYQRFLVETAKDCRVANPPCDGCCAGGVCDGPAYSRRWDDEDHDDDDGDDDGVTP